MNASEKISSFGCRDESMMLRVICLYFHIAMQILLVLSSTYFDYLSLVNFNGHFIHISMPECNYFTTKRM